jgi:SAM-dependent methyltransferase
MITKSKHWYAIKKSIPHSLYQPLLTGFYKTRSLLHKGDRVNCPVCGGNFDQFIEGHACPSCGSGKRHRLLYLFLKNETNFFSEKIKVLHFAPEYCFSKLFANQENLDYLSADLDSPRAMVQADMMNLNFPNESFDVVISSHVLEHVPDDIKAMKELHRIMKRSGWAIHQAPVDYTRANTFEDASIITNEQRLKHYGHIDHKRLYGRDYGSRLSEAGFSVREINYTLQFSEEQIQYHGLHKGEIIYFVKKF